MEAREIEQYLAELGRELEERGIKKPVRIMLIGGAFMLIQANAPRTTHDIDIFWLDEDGLTKVYDPLRESVASIKDKFGLESDWLNYLAQILMQEEVYVPNGKLWKQFGPLRVYNPAKEYILALKIAAGRNKDLEDCAILVAQTRTKTRKKAQELIDKYITDVGKERNAENIENSLSKLFERKQ